MKNTSRTAVESCNCTFEFSCFVPQPCGDVTSLPSRDLREPSEPGEARPEVGRVASTSASEKWQPPAVKSPPGQKRGGGKVLSAGITLKGTARSLLGAGRWDY